MSATNQPRRPGALDAFYTDPRVACACVATLGDLRDSLVWEPHAGGGAFVRALLDSRATVTASDINPDAPGLKEVSTSFVGDFLTYHPGDEPCDAPDWIVGNPPFNEAEAHVRHAIRWAAIGCAFILRLGFLEGACRRAFWTEHPAFSVDTFVNRPSFTGGKTDSCAYGWFVWRRGFVGRYSGGFLDWKGG